jgi:uncharacterized hydrophobic protein (TIGR00341 family)
MALRIIEVVASSDQGGTIRKVFSEHRPIDSWSVAEQEEGGRRVVIRALVDPDYQQSTLDALQDALTGSEGWRIVLHPVDAAIPKPEPDDEERERREAHRRASTREVLYWQIEKGARTTQDYLLFVALSTVVAGAALVTNTVAVLVGAMVIAPFLGPNLGFAFGVALGDRALMAEAAKTLGLGFALAVLLSIIGGALLPIDLEAKELLDRTYIGLDGMAVALASGACAALALTSGASASLVGVMVAVALLPPAVAMGIMLGAGEGMAALGAAELFAVNVASVNLSALAVFRFRGIEPRRWLRKFEARQSQRNAFVVLGALLLLLAAAILSQGYFADFNGFFDAQQSPDR